MLKTDARERAAVLLPQAAQQSKPKGILTKNMKITLACLTVMAVIALLVVAGTHHAHASHATHSSSQLSKHSALANTKHLSAKSVAHPTTTEPTPTEPQIMGVVPTVVLAITFVLTLFLFVAVFCCLSSDGDTSIGIGPSGRVAVVL